MTDVWLSAEATLRHVLAHELVPDAAWSKLDGMVRKGEIPAKAAHLRFLGKESSDTVIPLEFWRGQGRSVLIDFAKCTARSRVHWKPTLGIGGVGHAVTHCEEEADDAAGVAFSARHVYAVWPEGAALDRKGRVSPKRRAVIEAVEELFGSIEASAVIPVGMRNRKIMAWLKYNDRASVDSKTIQRALGTN